MEFEEFDQHVASLLDRAARSGVAAIEDFALIEGLTASAQEIAEAERALGAALPAKYKAFMLRYGAGQFGFLDLLPIPAAGATRHDEDVVAVSQAEFPDGAFVAVAPVGTGDYWCFPVLEGRCRDEVLFHYHDGGAPTWEAPDFLEFVAAKGIRP
ncbi:SMI1/KNR4 family protein [Micromonospora sp. A3M-1-15]|uniref:SMI1/KNR4 family protein n=1 Tax=Micromonospora TaxID=1873 RepID=UPI0020B7B91B|nr:SMI1/KNR4 family protein [Micromonospora sp. A3M-1-15]MCP3785211.1 SMI1/KNR4 family protein [Micromonospora sp. A3M-1-15]